MPTLTHLFGVALAGGLGTLARYGINHGAVICFGPHYPWGTYIANMFGCFLFGFLVALFSCEWLPSAWKPFILTGLLGGFTTFSAFAHENYQFIAQRRWDTLAWHLLGQNIFGIAAVLLGILLAETIGTKFSG